MVAPPPKIPRSTQGLLTTGLVGGWLAGSAFAVVFLVLLMSALGAARHVGMDMDLAMGAGVFVMLALFVWVGGMVCSVIGWFGMGALHPLGRAIAWLGIAVLACAVMLPMMGAALSVGGARGVATVGALIGVLYYALHAAFWARHGTARGVSRLAVVGGILAAASGLVAVAVVWSPPALGGPSAFLLITVFAGPVGAVLAHFGSGFAMGRERETVRALQSFE